MALSRRGTLGNALRPPRRSVPTRAHDVVVEARRHPGSGHEPEPRAGVQLPRTGMTWGGGATGGDQDEVVRTVAAQSPNLLGAAQGDRRTPGVVRCPIERYVLCSDDPHALLRGWPACV